MCSCKSWSLRHVRSLNSCTPNSTQLPLNWLKPFASSHLATVCVEPLGGGMPLWGDVDMAAGCGGGEDMDMGGNAAFEVVWKYFKYGHKRSVTSHE